jgi:toxin ParE1/3/4
VKRLVSFRSLASADLEEIAEYLAVRESPKRAERIVERLLERLRFLAAYPDAGTRRDDLRVGIRTWPEGPCMLIYREVPEGIEVIRIAHGARLLELLVTESF